MSGYVVRCGRAGLFLAEGNRRAATADRAKHFVSEELAEAAARALISMGAIWALPWQVHPVTSDTHRKETAPAPRA